MPSSTPLLVCRDLRSDTDALGLCRPADADLGVPLVIGSGDGCGGGGRGDRGEGEAGDEGCESKLEKNSAASEGDRTCVARIRGLVGRVPGAPPSLGLEATPEPKLGAALSKAGVPTALDEPPFCKDCNDGVISILPPPITVRLVSFALSRFIE